MGVWRQPAALPHRLPPGGSSAQTGMTSSKANAPWPKRAFTEKGMERESGKPLAWAAPGMSSARTGDGISRTFVMAPGTQKTRYKLPGQVSWKSLPPSIPSSLLLNPGQKVISGHQQVSVVWEPVRLGLLGVCVCLPPTHTVTHIVSHTLLHTHSRAYKTHTHVHSFHQTSSDAISLPLLRQHHPNPQHTIRCTQTQPHTSPHALVSTQMHPLVIQCVDTQHIPSGTF